MLDFVAAALLCTAPPPAAGGGAVTDAHEIAALVAAIEAREASFETVESVDRSWWVPTAKTPWISMGVGQRGWCRDGRWYMLHTEDAARGGDANFYISGNGRMITFPALNPTEPRVEKLNGLIKEPSCTVRDGDKSLPVFLGLTVETLLDRTVAELFRSSTALRLWSDPRFPGCPGLEGEVEMYGHKYRQRVVLDPAHGMAMKYMEQFDLERSFPLQRLIVSAFEQCDGTWVPSKGTQCAYTLLQTDAKENAAAMAEVRTAIETANLPGTAGEPERAAVLMLFESEAVPGKEGFLWRPVSKNLKQPLVPQLWECKDVRIGGDFVSFSSLAQPFVQRGLMSAWTYGHSTVGESLPALGFSLPPANQTKE